QGWRLIKAGGHAHIWGTILCPRKIETAVARACSAPQGIRRITPSGCEGRWITALTDERIDGGIMREYEFAIILADVTEFTEEMGNALFAAGCDDCSPGSCNGVVRVDFDREGDSLEQALRSAISDVHAAGYSVDHVEIDSDAEVLKV